MATPNSSNWISRPASWRVTELATVRVGKAGLSCRKFLEIGLGLLEIGLQACLLLGAAGLLDIVFELRDLLGDVNKLLFDKREPAQFPASGLVKFSLVRSEVIISRAGEAAT